MMTHGLGLDQASRLACMALGVAVCWACSTDRRIVGPDDTTARIPETLTASEFLLKSPSGEVRARLGLKDDEPVLQLFQRQGTHCQMEVGLGPFGSPQITLHATKSYDGATVTLSNEGCPGEMCLEMRTAPDGSGNPAVLRILLERGGQPSIEYVARDGKRQTAALTVTK